MTRWKEVQHEGELFIRQLRRSAMPGLACHMPGEMVSEIFDPDINLPVLADPGIITARWAKTKHRTLGRIEGGGTVRPH